jgi:hypothetical protein
MFFINFACGTGPAENFSWKRASPSAATVAGMVAAGEAMVEFPLLEEAG